MSTRVIRVGPGSVRVSHGEVDVVDVLEYALAAIREYGWRQGEGKYQGDPDDKVAKDEGLTLHDAVGHACVMLSRATGEAVGKSTPSGTKDWATPRQDVHGKNTVENIRSRANKALEPLLVSTSGQRMNDKTWNDQAKDVTEVIDVLERAIKKERTQ